MICLLVGSMQTEPGQLPRSVRSSCRSQADRCIVGFEKAEGLRPKRTQFVRLPPCAVPKFGQVSRCPEYRQPQDLPASNMLQLYTARYHLARSSEVLNG